MDMLFAGMVYIPHRMRELGYGTDYVLRLTSFSLAPLEKKKVEAYNEYYYLIISDEDITIKSFRGQYDPTDIDNPVQEEEHYGLITLENTSSDQNRKVFFIKVTPKNQ